tara:strand:- start:644 stop:1678 length:1035 start_codon:yes stop_codon:yes gene_type:complete
MALGSGHQTITTAANFVPELWEDDVIATYKLKTVMANLVKKMNHKGQKGDTFHIPSPGRGEASVKAANTQVTLVTDTAGTIPVLIDKHYEYSVMYEDLASMQALAGMRPFYTDDAGFALAKRIDRELHKKIASLQGGSIAGATNLYETAVIGGDGSTAFSGASSGNGTALTDAGLRTAIQTLEDSDVNSAELSLIIPPVEAKVLRGISRFTEQAFVGDGNVIKTGRLGNLYGVEIFTSTNCPWVHTNSVTNTQSVSFSSTAPTGTAYSDEFGFAVDWATSTPTDTKFRICSLIHKDALCLVEQQGVRVQTQYKQEYLGNLVTADNVFGTAELRDYAGIGIAVPA